HLARCGEFPPEPSAPKNPRRLLSASGPLAVSQAAKRGNDRCKASGGLPSKQRESRLPRRRPLQPPACKKAKSVTHVSGTKCHLCLGLLTTHINDLNIKSVFSLFVFAMPARVSEIRGHVQEI